MQKTHLYNYHSKNGKLVSFANFQMPIWYKGINSEHLSVRNSVGIFDVTHMGRVIIDGSDAEEFLNYVTTNNVSNLNVLDAQYSVMCNENGGIIDDFVLSRLEEKRYFLVYNAANREKNHRWLMKQSANFRVQLRDGSNQMAMFAVQGPKAQETLEKISTGKLETERFQCCWSKLSDIKVFTSRTGYTGEDGFEIFVWDTPISNPEKAITVWHKILEAGDNFNIEPCGLGSRDTLRLEAGLCLYGNDIDEEKTPLEAKLSFVVKFEKGDFIGRKALFTQKQEGVEKKRVCLKMREAGIPRPKQEVFKDGELIGYVTSGTYSPLLKQGIAMAYIKSTYAKHGDTVNVKIRKKLIDAEIIRPPFYDKQKYGSTRNLD